MNSEKLFRIIGDVDDDLVEEAAASTAPAAPRPVLKRVLRWGALAACLALVLGLGLSRLTSPAPDTVSPPAGMSDGAAPRTDGGMVPYGSDEPAPSSVPMGVRKFFNYNGYRYAFLEDGAPQDLSGAELESSLGALEHDILAGMDGTGDNQAAVLNFATTFALGGELYELPGYDPAYRLAVVWEGETYLAELVGRVDNAPLDIGDYFAVSKLATRVRRVDILPHMGWESLSTVEGAQAEALVELLAEARPAELAEADYLAVANAQSTGRSWQLVLGLDDGTNLTIYLIPDLGYVSIGDSTYLLPARFEQAWGGHFDGLVQGEPPLS